MSKIEQFYQYIEGLGYLGYVVFIGAYIIATVAFIPGSALTIGAGLVFGVVKGSIAVSIGSIIGASLAFLIARYFARERVEKKVGQNPKFRAIDRAIGKEGGKIVFLLRLTPVVPFSLGNYLYGLTSVPFNHYFIASWIGMLPGTILYVYIGSLGKAAAEAGTEGASTGQLIAKVVGLLATLAVTIYITKVARAALKKSALEDEKEQTPAS